VLFFLLSPVGERRAGWREVFCYILGERSAGLRAVYLIDEVSYLPLMIASAWHILPKWGGAWHCKPLDRSKMMVGWRILSPGDWDFT
jgi:hypothetical protein